MHRLAASSLTTCGPKILVAKSANRVSNRTGSLARVPKKTDYGLCQPETLRIETANRERSPRLDLRVTFPSTLPFYPQPLLPNSFSSFVAFPFWLAWFFARRYLALLSFIDFTFASKTVCVLFFVLSSLFSFPFIDFAFASKSTFARFFISFFFLLVSLLRTYAFAFLFYSFYLCLEVDLHAFHAFPCFISLAFTRKSVAALFHHSLSLLFSRWILRGFSLCTFWFDASVTLVVCQGIGADFFELFLALLYSIGSSPLIPSSVCLLTLHWFTVDVDGLITRWLHDRT